MATKYVNPNHPCGTLYPQEAGFIRGFKPYEGGVKGDLSHPSQMRLIPSGSNKTETIVHGRS